MWRAVACPEPRAPHEGLHLQADTVAGARLRGLRPPHWIADAAQRFEQEWFVIRARRLDEINSDVLSTCRARRAELAAVRRQLAAAGDDRAGARDTTPAVRRPLTLFAASLCLAAVASAASPAARLQPADADPARAVLDCYCVTCHNQRLRTGGPRARRARSWRTSPPSRGRGKRWCERSGRARCRRRGCRGPTTRPPRRCARRSRGSSIARPRPNPGPAAAAPAQSRRVRQRRPRSARARRRRHVAAAGRRLGVRLRQQRRPARGLAVAARALSRRRPTA